MSYGVSPTMTASDAAHPRLSSAAWTMSGSGFDSSASPDDVRRCDETLDAGAPKQPLEFFLARGAGDSERVPLAGQVRDQFLRAGQPLHGGKVPLPEDLAATFSEALPFGRVLFNSHELG